MCRIFTDFSLAMLIALQMSSTCPTNAGGKNVFSFFSLSNFFSSRCTFPFRAVATFSAGTCAGIGFSFASRSSLEVLKCVNWFLLIAMVRSVATSLSTRLQSSNKYCVNGVTGFVEVSSPWRGELASRSRKSLIISIFSHN
jgi:hypothetical protein